MTNINNLGITSYAAVNSLTVLVEDLTRVVTELLDGTPRGITDSHTEMLRRLGNETDIIRRELRRLRNILEQQGTPI